MTFFGCLLGVRDFVYRLDGVIWARFLLWVTGIKMEVRGIENLPKDDRGFLFLFNHTSYIDIIAMLGGLPKIPQFGAKIELFKIPFFGTAMRALGTLPIARNNRNEVLRLYKEAKQRVDQGEVFALAPEGTRQTGGMLGRFKKGPFIFAIQAEMSVVPVLIVGAEQIQPKGSYLMNVGSKWTRQLILQILPRVHGSDFSSETIDDFQKEVRLIMEPKYEELQKELGVNY